MKVWHVTPEANLSKILEEGLLPQIGPNATLYGEAHPAVYCFASHDDMLNGVSNWLGELFEDTPLVILELDITKLRSHSTPITRWEVCVTEPIQPKRIVSIHSDTGKLLYRKREDGMVLHVDHALKIAA